MFAVDMSDALLSILAHIGTEFIKYCELCFFDLIVFFLSLVSFSIIRCFAMCFKMFSDPSHLDQIAQRKSELQTCPLQLQVALCRTRHI